MSAPQPGGPTPTSNPPRLEGAARELMREKLAAADGAEGPSKLHATSGFETASSGERVPYDRYCLVGSTLQAERAGEFDALVAELTARGGVFYVFHQRSDGKPGKVLVNLDGQRVVVSTLQW